MCYTATSTITSASLLHQRYRVKSCTARPTVMLQAFITCSRKGDWRLSRKADRNGLVQVNTTHCQGAEHCTVLHCRATPTL